MVPIIITGRGDKVTTAQKDHAKDKIQKLERYFNGITRIEVMLDDKASEGCRAELVISVKRGSQIVVHQDSKDLYAAIDVVLDKAEVQLTRYKEKLQSRRSRSSQKLSALEGMVEETQPENLQSYEEIVDEQEFQ